MFRPPKQSASYLFFLKKNKILFSFFAIFLILFIAQFIYFFRENASLKSKLLSANDKLVRQNSRIDIMGEYFENKGNFTLTNLAETLKILQIDEERIEKSIEIINGNAAIMDRNFKKVQEQIQRIDDELSTLRGSVLYILGRL